MAWTTPKTWASGYVVLAADLNTHLRDQLNVTAPAVMTTAGDIIYASGANTPARLAKSTTSTQYLANTGTSNVPAWNEVALATGVSGTLPVGNGGIGATTLTANGALIGNGTSAITSVDMSTKGGLLAGDGSGNPSVLAVGGTADHVLTVDSGEATGMKWAAGGAGGTAFVGTQTTEANTASTSAVDLLTVGSVSIAVTAWIQISFNTNKQADNTSGVAYFGLKQNSTVIKEASSSAYCMQMPDNNSVQLGTCQILCAPRISGAVASGGADPMAWYHVTQRIASGGAHLSSAVAPTAVTAAQVQAVITSVILRAASNHGSNTVYADDLHVLSYAES
jgi:hypothetical protein